MKQGSLQSFLWSLSVVTALLTFNNAVFANESDVSIRAEQAVDIACDGVLDGIYDTNPLSVTPGNNCVRYRLTVTNDTADVLHNVLIEDSTPDYTVYQSLASCSDPACVVSEPEVGGVGAVTGTIPSIASGGVVEFFFTVKIE